MTLVAGILQRFFSDRLVHQRGASSNTIAAYRDTFRPLLVFAEKKIGKAPSSLPLSDLDCDFIGAFLEHLEKGRGNTARTRNARLAAIHSFFRFVALEEPAHSATCQRILAIPSKKTNRKLVAFLNRAEMRSLLETPDRRTRLGRRDHVLLLVLLQTGLRVAEVAALRRQDIILTTGAHVRCMGKGRKERCTPLTREAVLALRAWLLECPLDLNTPAFPSQRSTALSPDAIQDMVARHASTARRACPSLTKKRVTPHVLRHTAAVRLLEAGVDRAVIALWLGHESVETTQIYLDADLSAKERALARIAPSATAQGRFRAGDKLLAFLKGL